MRGTTEGTECVTVEFWWTWLITISRMSNCTENHAVHCLLNSHSIQTIKFSSVLRQHAALKITIRRGLLTQQVMRLQWT